MRLPRPCRLRSGLLSVCSLTSAGEFGIGEPLSCDLIHRQCEAVSIVQKIVFRGAIVEAEHLLRDVTVKMEGLDSNIGSTQSAFQECPEVLYALRMNLATHILFNVVTVAWM